MVLEDIFYVFPIISLWELLIHRVWPVRIPGDLCFEALEYAATYLKYMVLEKKNFKVSPKISLWKLLIHRMWTVLTPGA